MGREERGAVAVATRRVTSSLRASPGSGRAARGDCVTGVEAAAERVRSAAMESASQGRGGRASRRGYTRRAGRCSGSCSVDGGGPGELREGWVARAPGRALRGGSSPPSGRRCAITAIFGRRSAAPLLYAGLGNSAEGFCSFFFCEQRALFFTFPLQVCMSRLACWLLTISALCFSSVTDISLNSPNKGLLSDAMMDVPVDSAAAARTATPEGLSAAEEEELRAEIAKVKPHLSPGSCPAGRERRGFDGRCGSGAWAFWILMVMLPGGLCVLC